MAEEQWMILSQKPKKLIYTERLLNMNQPETLLEKAKRYVRKDKTGPYSISEWASHLGSTKDNQNARDYLEYLVEKNALKKDGVKGSPPNKTPVYSLDKQKLIECFCNSSYYQWNRDLFLKAIKNAEEKITITTDI